MPSRRTYTTSLAKTRQFSSAEDIQQALRTQNEESLVESERDVSSLCTKDLTRRTALTSLRNQISVKYEEETILIEDPRLVLVKAWLELSSGAQNVFAIWEQTSTVRR